MIPNLCMYGLVLFTQKLVHWHVDNFFDALSSYYVLQHQSGIIRHPPASTLKIFPHSHKIAPFSFNIKSSTPVITKQWNSMHLFLDV